MKINISEFEKLDQLREKARRLLSIPNNIKIDFGLDSTHALNEVTRGIAELFPHKKSIATLGALPTPLGQIAKEFAKLGFIVQQLPINFKLSRDEQKNNLVSELEKLKKDTLFILCSDVEPFTGALYPLELIKNEILSKNIFIVNYQSPSSLLGAFKIPESPFECGIYDPLWSRETATCLILKGERAVIEPLIWSESSLNEKNVELLCEKIKASVKKGYFEERILLDFEIKMKNEFPDTVSILPMSVQRINDRAVLFVKAVNGDALAKEMIQQGFECSTADADFWNDPKFNSWLPQNGFSIEEAQTSFIISVESLQKPEAFDKLCAAIRKYQKISGY